MHLTYVVWSVGYYRASSYAPHVCCLVCRLLQSLIICVSHLLSGQYVTTEPHHMHLTSVVWSVGYYRASSYASHICCLVSRLLQSLIICVSHLLSGQYVTTEPHHMHLTSVVWSVAYYKA
ncbi:hypothetical protein DPMN_167915 [Dreissena polymorpha]|uniref:Uncharacterized protein n=1 Tax=Dreissena polymorpha TaxID=45954 RepID=A0A9D4F133_DREPO|nr:hypothetical protein DPMN_167915 [Dreissena polymorpha]